MIKRYWKMYDTKSTISISISESETGIEYALRHFRAGHLTPQMSDDQNEYVERLS